MQKLNEKIVFITGASSGIGQAVAKQFAELGASLIIAARRGERLQALAEQLQSEYGVHVLPIELDVRNNEQIKQVVDQLPPEWQGIEILVNNAGLALSVDKIQDADINNWDTMIDTNIKGLLYVTHAILPGMILRQAGHIINVGSIAGRTYYPSGNVYCATKHAVKAICKTLRLDLMGTPIRVSEIAPGAVETEFSLVRFKGDAEKAKNVYQGFEPLTANDIADTISYCATRPAHVNVSLLEIYPQAQAYADKIYKTTQP
jgi:NADP-dependent 3-hydroxy acid dehydrogenase YdfG